MKELSLNERINKQWDKVERYRQIGNDLFRGWAENDLKLLIAERDKLEAVARADIHAGEQ